MIGYMIFAVTSNVKSRRGGLGVDEADRLLAGGLRGAQRRLQVPHEGNNIKYNSRKNIVNNDDITIVILIIIIISLVLSLLLLLVLLLLLLLLWLLLVLLLVLVLLSFVS